MTYTVTFNGYTVQADTLRKAQMILAQARREREDGDIDLWYYAGCPVGRSYSKWAKGVCKTHHYESYVAFHRHNSPCKVCGKTSRHSVHSIELQYESGRIPDLGCVC